MARQMKSSRSGYAAKHKVKCSSCGNPSNDIAIAKIRGVAKWVCSLCKHRLAQANGV